MMKATAFSFLLVGCFLIVQGRNVQQGGQPDSRCQGRYGLFPIPGDCTHFLVCGRNQSTVRECPKDMEFHPILYCTDKEEAKCSQGLPLEMQARPDEFPCPRKYGMVPYPGDCTKYVVCSEGLGKVETCPDNQGFVEYVGCVDTKDCPPGLRSRDEDETEAPSNDILSIVRV